MTRPRWVVFDYGEVISRRTAAIPAMAEVLGVPVEEFEPAYFVERDSYDRGCPERRYWQAVGSRVGVDVDAELARELTRVDNDGWLDTDPESLRLLDDLDSRSVPMALLSNASAAFGRAAERQPWARHFRALVFSGDLEILKPDPEIYSHLLRVIDARAADCLFFDDRQPNVEAARTFGMHAELWRGAGNARELLRGHGIHTA